MSTMTTPRRPRPWKPAPRRKTTPKAPARASAKVTYSKRATAMDGSRPTVARAPIPAMVDRDHALAGGGEERHRGRGGHHAEHRRHHARHDRRTGAQRRCVDDEHDDAERDRQAAEDDRSAPGASRQRPREDRRDQHCSEVPPPVRTDRHDLGDEHPHRDHDQRHRGHDGRAPGAEAIHGARPARRVGALGPAIGGVERAGHGGEGYWARNRRLASEGLTSRALRSRSGSRVAVSTPGPACACASTSPRGSTTIEWPQ